MLGPVAEELLALDPRAPDASTCGIPRATSRPRCPRPRARRPCTGSSRCGSTPSSTGHPSRQVLGSAAVAPRRILGGRIALPRLRGQPVVVASRTGPTGSGRPASSRWRCSSSTPTSPSTEWMTRWHTRISPITEAIQPRCRYVRNAVFRPITDGAPPLAGHRGGGVAVTRARHRPDAVLLRRRRPRADERPRHRR